jgi:hypothetical protein
MSHTGDDMIFIRRVTTVEPNLNIYTRIKLRVTSLLPLLVHHRRDEAHAGHGAATGSVFDVWPY